MGTYDQLNRQRLSQLQPHVEKAALKALAEAEKAGLDILITQGLRTYAEQDALYAQGRTKPGKIVTNARAGYSYHNFGLAFDFVIIKNGKAVWDENHPDWKKFVAICKKHGFEWGGDWKSFKDYPHFQMTGGLSLAQCRAKWPGGWKPGKSSGGGSMYKADDTLPLKFGSKDGSKKLVSKVQKALGIKADGYYGPNTEKAVKEFQTKKGLVVDGIVGEKTWAALFPPEPKYKADDELPLQLYSKDGNKKLVSKVQEKLGVKVDGYYGPNTEKAVKEFQKKHGLKVDGIVGEKTWNALFSPEQSKKIVYAVYVNGKRLGQVDAVNDIQIKKEEA